MKVKYQHILAIFILLSVATLGKDLVLNAPFQISQLSFTELAKNFKDDLFRYIQAKKAGRSHQQSLENEFYYYDDEDDDADYIPPGPNFRSICGPPTKEVRKYGKCPTFYIRTTPSEARVRIMNVEPVYRPYMDLPVGEYDIEISHPGYKTKRFWLKHDRLTLEHYRLEKM